MKTFRQRLRLLVIMAALCVIAYWRLDYWREHRYDKLIVAAGHKYGVDPALVKAVCWRESWFYAGARGKVGELGLMQVREAAAGEWAKAEHIEHFEQQERLDPATNLKAGTWYLAKLMQRYKQTDNPVVYALADYNAGRGNVLRWISGAGATNSAAFLEQISFPSTRAYVNAILNREQRYKPM